uniref:VWFD domain-containing protein n=1 Tax=Plectus sambesii TaxID=2011161 RepID=A0A914XVG7_9BILA
MIPWVLCCYKQSESLCQLYEEKRPSDPTTNYTAPRPAAASGDPHITTFDLLGYTFNGAGEFWMLRNSSVQPVLLQARMEKYSDGGVEKLATIFTAFVMKDQSSPTIQV